MAKSILAMVLLCVFFACQTTVEKPRPFTIACAAAPQTLDPALATDTASIILLQSTREGLVVLNPAGSEAWPGMAQSWERGADGRSYTFHLRAAQWSDGTPVSAQQFVDSWKRLLDPVVASPHAWLLTGLVAGAGEYAEIMADPASTESEKAAAAVGLQIKALDESTLFIKTVAKTSTLDLALAHPAFLPLKGSDPAALRAVNGAYIPVDAKDAPGGAIELRANVNYWDRANIHIDAFRLAAGGDRRLAAYEQGSVDYLPDLVPNQAGQSVSGDQQTHPRLESQFVIFNCRQKPWSDYRVRQALSLAIDRVALLRAIKLDSGLVAGDIIPLGFISGGPGAYDLEQAKKLLGQAGFGKSSTLPAINFLTTDSPLDQAVAAELQAQWQRNLGLKLTITALPRRDYLLQRRIGEFDLARGGWRSGLPDPESFLASFVGNSPANDGAWVNPEYDALWAQISYLNRAKAREAAISRAREILTSQMPAIPLYFAQSNNLINLNLWGGWQANPSNTHLIKYLFRKKIVN